MVQINLKSLGKLMSVIFLGTFLTLLSSGSPIAAPKGWPSRTTIGGGPMQGTYYVLAAGWSSLLNKKLKISSSVESTAGSSVNAKLLSGKKQDFGLVSSGVALQAYSGKGFAKGIKYTDLRLIVPGQMLPVQFWTPKSSGLKKLKDLTGKRVNFSRPGSAVDIFGQNLRRVTGLKPKQVTNVGHGQANRLMKDGLLDIASTVGSPPHPAVAAITSQDDFYVFGMGHGNLAKKMTVAFPQFVLATIPAGMYRGNPQAIPTIAELNWLAAGAHSPESLVYAVTKATFENKKALVASHKAWALMDAANVQHAKIPLHPGAVRYYKEKGIKLP